MERHIVLAHKLIQRDLFGILPPFWVIFSQKIGCDWDIADGSIIPHIEYFLFVLLDRDTHSPFQIPSNTLLFQPHVGPGLSEGNRVLRPFSFYTRLINPFLQSFLDIWQVNKKVLSGFVFGLWFADGAIKIQHFNWRVEQFAAFVTLISTTVRVFTRIAGSSYKSICQE